MNTKSIILALILSALIGVTAYCSFEVYDKTQKRARIKEDISKVNDIMFGMLSVNRWESEIKKIAEKQVDEFTLTPEQDSIVRVALNDVLRGVITKADKVIQDDDGTILKYIRKQAVNLFFDVKDFKKNIPKLTDAIMIKLTSEEGKDRLRSLVMSKMEELSAITYDSARVEQFNKYLNKYNTNTREEFNNKVNKETEELEIAGLNNSLVVIAIAIIFLLVWLVFIKDESVKHVLIFSSLLFGAVVLLTGVLSPMIEIDARVQTMNFVILGEKIEFTDQYIFYRSKSIGEIIKIMMQTGKYDSIIVAGLILAFSVLLPFTKLVSMGIYTLNNKFRNSKVGSWFALYSGKWSMADVMVVAIFMAYVAFQGILESQLNGLNQSSETMTAITTNHTTLQPGFYIFVTYVLFSIILSTFINRVIKKVKLEKEKDINEIDSEVETSK